MCGICGYVAFSKGTSSEGAHVRVKAMLESLSHRGPDATGQIDTDLAVLGKIGEFGQPVIKKKADGLLEEFARNLVSALAATNP